MKLPNAIFDVVSVRTLGQKKFSAVAVRLGGIYLHDSDRSGSLLELTLHTTGTFSMDVLWFKLWHPKKS